MKKLSLFLVAISILGMGATLGSCKKKPSIVKIYVRSQTGGDLQTSASVVIIGDINSNPVTNAYVDTVQTNASGFAQFDLKELFDSQGKKRSVAYLDIIVKKNGKEGEGRIKVRAYNTAVETITLLN